MLARLSLDILQHIPPATRPIKPIQEPPGPIIRRPATRIVHRLPSHDATHDDAGHDAVPGHGEGLLGGAQRDEEEVGQQVRAEEQRGEEDGDEAVEEQGSRVVGEEEEAEGGGGVGVGEAGVEG